jgi:tRNA threonylcarbamoyladenosine biosynthesis protein TsaE
MTGDDPQAQSFTSGSVATTEAIAARLIDTLKFGGVVALQGELGAGKTQFVRGLVRALGGDPGQVHSPTFGLLHEYTCAGRRLFHLDAYRIDSGELEAIGFDELLSRARQGDVIALEWAEKVRALIPADAIWVRIDVASPTRRQISMAPLPPSP